MLINSRGQFSACGGCSTNVNGSAIPDRFLRTSMSITPLRCYKMSQKPTWMDDGYTGIWLDGRREGRRDGGRDGGMDGGINEDVCTFVRVRKQLAQSFMEGEWSPSFLWTPNYLTLVSFPLPSSSHSFLSFTIDSWVYFKCPIEQITKPK